MNPRVFLFPILIIIVLGVVAFYFVRMQGPTQAPSVVATTTSSTADDAAASDTPAPQPVPTLVSVEAAINQGASALGVLIVPESVTQDSRCPTDVQCIQAGTVQVKARVSSGTSSTTEELFTLGTPVLFNGTSIILTDVTPAKNSKITLKPSDYSFTFRIEDSVSS